MNLQFLAGRRDNGDGSALTATFITISGRSAWFIGALLLLIYAIFALTLYVVPPGSSP